MKAMPEDPFASDQVSDPDGLPGPKQALFDILKQMLASGDQLIGIELESGVHPNTGVAHYAMGGMTSAGVTFYSAPIDSEQVLSTALSHIAAVSVTEYEQAMVTHMIDEGWELQDRAHFLAEVRKVHRGQ
jgi:hypothetical protein